MARNGMKKIKFRSRTFYGVRGIWKLGNGQLIADWVETVHKDEKGYIADVPYQFYNSADDPALLAILERARKKIGQPWCNLVNAEIVGVEIPMPPIPYIWEINAASEGAIKTLAPMLSKTKAQY